MIPALLLLGAIGVGAVLATFWDDIVNWLKKAIVKVQEAIRRAIVGFTVFLKKVNSFIKEISKHYSKNEQGRWEETVVTREVNESEVPAEILAKLEKSNSQSQELDISSEMQLKLGH